MPTREQIKQFVNNRLNQWIHNPNDIWVAIYRLLLDYAHGVPRITDSNRLTKSIWRNRAKNVENDLASAMGCTAGKVANKLDVLMRRIYPPGTQRMNPIGIAFVFVVVYLIRQFSTGSYQWKTEVKIGDEVFPKLNVFRRKNVDIVAFHHKKPYAVISCKWGMRHDRIRDPQEEADIYKGEVPSLKFFVVTNEFDSAKLQKLLSYPTIDGVFHVRRDLVWQVYGGKTPQLSSLRDLTDLFALFP